MKRSTATSSSFLYEPGYTPEGLVLAMQKAGALTWTPHSTAPWFVRHQGWVFICVLFGVLGVFASVVTALDDDFPTLIVFAITTGVTALFSLVLWKLVRMETRWRSMLPGAAIERTKFAIQCGETVPRVIKGRISAVQSETFPALTWNSNRLALGGPFTVTSQPFVVTTDHESWLVDNQHVEAAGFSQESSLVSRGVVGDTVYLFPRPSALVAAPAWALTASTHAGYRKHQLRKLEGTPNEPIQLVVST